MLNLKKHSLFNDEEEMAGGSFGARACRAIRRRLLTQGVEAALPKSWRRSWMIARILATPPWVDMKPIKKLYDEAAEMTQRMGVRYVVDHIIPLQHPRVCGLHVDWNMRVITYKENAAKSNHFCPEQMELFEFNPQFEFNL